MSAWCSANRRAVTGSAERIVVSGDYAGLGHGLRRPFDVTPSCGTRLHDLAFRRRGRHPTGAAVVLCVSMTMATLSRA